MRWCYYTSSARAIWLLPSAPPPPPSLPLAAHRLSSPQPHPKIQKCHLATSHPPWALCECYRPPPRYLPFLGEQQAPEAAQ